MEKTTVYIYSSDVHGPVMCILHIRRTQTEIWETKKFHKTFEPALNNSRDFLVDFVIRHPVLVALLSPSLSPTNLPPRWLALPFWLVKHQPPTPTILLTNVRGLETQMCLGSLGKFIIFLTFLYTVLNGFLLLAMSMQRQQMASTSCQHQRGPAVTPWQQSNRL